MTVAKTGRCMEMSLSFIIRYSQVVEYLRVAPTFLSVIFVAPTFLSVIFVAPTFLSVIFVAPTFLSVMA
jgi:hypothetical protein